MIRARRANDPPRAAAAGARAPRRAASSATAEGYVAPPGRRRRRSRCRCARTASGLQLLAPFAPWDGNDYADAAVAPQGQGEVHDGPHLARRAPGCASAATSTTSPTTCSSARSTRSRGEAGKTRNPLTGEAVHPSPPSRATSRRRGCAGSSVGDENYGEGSSREHAAMSPRHLGGAAVIVRSFARIHESNLKKQGILPLTFVEPADYDKVRETDRISVLGLAGLAPGKPVDRGAPPRGRHGGADRAEAHAQRRADRLVQGRLGAERAAGEEVGEATRRPEALRPWSRRAHPTHPRRGQGWIGAQRPAGEEVGEATRRRRRSGLGLAGPTRPTPGEVKAGSALNVLRAKK